MSEDLEEKPFLDMDDLNLHEIRELWDGVDIEALGRVLRAHLTLEHYVNEHLDRRNPNLGDYRKLRLEFAQRLDLLDMAVPLVRRLLPGLKRINTIRNHYAHNPHYEVTGKDTDPFYCDPGFFEPYLAARFKGRGARADLSPIEQIEAFAEFASTWLRTGTALMGKLSEKERELHEERLQIKAQRELLADLAPESEDEQEPDEPR
jgi:hypothetical protein